MRRTSGRSVLAGTPDADVLARAVDEQRTLVTQNAADFLPLLDQRQSAGLAMTPVLVAVTARRGVAGALHARLADAVHEWAATNSDPYAHAHWLDGRSPAKRRQVCDA